MLEVDKVSDIVKRLSKYFTISVASRRNSGKTHLMSQLIRELITAKKVDIVVIMTGSAGLNDDYKDIVPEKLIQPFSELTLKSIWTVNANKEAKDRKHTLVVLDDCLGTPEALRNNEIMRYYTLGRHCHLSMVIISQHSSVLLSPIIRGNSDIILYSKLNVQQLKQLHEATTNITLKDFIKVSETLGGKDYQFMLIDNLCKSTDVKDWLTVVRADAEIKIVVV